MRQAAQPLKAAGKGELVTLEIRSPTNTQRWVGRGCLRPQPGRRGPLFLLLCPTYLSGSPIRRGKAERTGWGDWEWGAVRRNVSSGTTPASGILEQLLTSNQ